jgi:hypothetical protein
VVMAETLSRVRRAEATLGHTDQALETEATPGDLRAGSAQPAVRVAQPARAERGGDRNRRG